MLKINSKSGKSWYSKISLIHIGQPENMADEGFLKFTKTMPSLKYET
jgi:hypothetical protein